MILKIEDLKKNYRGGSQEVPALKGVSLQLGRGEFVSIMGPSGSGKSTLLHLIGGLDRADGGRVSFNGKVLGDLSDNELSHFRRRHLGFVFQFFNLLPTMTVLENVLLPVFLDGQTSREKRERAHSLLKSVGLADRAHHYPSELSGGQMQRVAVARALIANPYLILADEPTGSLDSKTGDDVLNLLASLVKNEGQTVLMVTHDRRAASFGARLITMRDGLIENDEQLQELRV